MTEKIAIHLSDGLVLVVEADPDVLLKTIRNSPNASPRSVTTLIGRARLEMPDGSTLRDVDNPRVFIGHVAWIEVGVK